MCMGKKRRRLGKKWNLCFKIIVINVERWINKWNTFDGYFADVWSTAGLFPGTGTWNTYSSVLHSWLVVYYYMYAWLILIINVLYKKHHLCSWLPYFQNPQLVCEKIILSFSIYSIYKNVHKYLLVDQIQVRSW